ncbi:MAG: DUF2071 domain-containing protein [Aureliella sp.]
MRIPTIRGVIDRRVLVNFRVDAEVLAGVCPPPFRPQTFGGYGIAGICLIRLRNIRPEMLPAFCGISSENAAHRIAVEWDSENGTQSGVYIPRRDTSSALNALVGGRLFPGIHHRARFDVQETDREYRIAMHSLDGAAHLVVDGETAESLPSHSVFDLLEQCSQFFEAGSVGYSPASNSGRFDGLELRTDRWSITPLAVSDVQSSFFDDTENYPSGSVTFDNALLMRGIDHQWQSRESLCCENA